MAAYGADSPECAAASAAVFTASNLGTLASAGAVTREAVDEAFAEPALADLPTELEPSLQQLKTISTAIIGQTAQESAAYAAPFSDAARTLTIAVSTVCS